MDGFLQIIVLLYSGTVIRGSPFSLYTVLAWKDTAVYVCPQRLGSCCSSRPLAYASLMRLTCDPYGKPVDYVRLHSTATHVTLLAIERFKGSPSGVLQSAKRGVGADATWREWLKSEGRCLQRSRRCKSIG